MPFVNQTDTRAIQQRFGKYEHIDEPSFGEVFDASVGQVFDEELSISSMLNREGFDRRNQLIDEKVQSGEIDGEKYKISTTGRPGQAKSGRLDYARIAKDYESEEIRTDEVLTQERNELLKSRRDYAQDVMERGSGLAQFTGGLTAYMLDPVNIATVGIAAPVTVGKGLTTLGRAMLTARNAALIEGATELGIQTFVYAHKQDIDSPYTSADALANIGMAATGAAVLGGVAGGLAGWLDRVVKFADELPKTKDVEYSIEYIKRMQASIDQARKERANYDAAMGDYQKVLDGEYKDFIEASNNTIKTLQEEIKTFTKEAQTVDKLIAQKGGMNRAALESEGIDIADMQAIKGQFGKPVFRAEGGMSVDDLVESLNEIGYKGGEVSYNDALDILDNIARGESVFLNPEDMARIDFNKRQIEEMEMNQDNDYLKGIYGEIRERDIQADIDFLTQMEARAEEYAKPSKTADQYEIPEPRKPISRQTVTQREQDILARQGIADNYHAELEEFNALENKILEIDGEQIDAGDLMKSFDDELEGLESVLTCVYKGAA